MNPIGLEMLSCRDGAQSSLVSRYRSRRRRLIVPSLIQSGHDLMMPVRRTYLSAANIGLLIVMTPPSLLLVLDYNTRRRHTS